MGYTTYFDGEFVLDNPLSKEHFEYMKAFSQTRRMKRSSQKALKIPDPLREAVDLPIGLEGGYFVGNTNNFGQESDDSVTNSNISPKEQPGLWCQWTPSEGGSAIVHDEGEKFYFYIEWIEYLIKHFIEPWGYKLNGEVYWRGEEDDDMGKIFIDENEVDIKHGRVVYV